MGGALGDVRVVEIASERTAHAGQLLGQLGADVVLVENVTGHGTRSFGPFIDDAAGEDRSLWWMSYNTHKRGVSIDLSDGDGREQLIALLSSADIVLEGLSAEERIDLALNHAALSETHPSLIWVSVTPFGADSARNAVPTTDLTLLASGGIAWSCGYDDHSLPPVAGEGEQAYRTGGVWAVMGALTALAHRDQTGRGQHVDVSINAAVNVTTEQATLEWNVARNTVERQTGRHAQSVVTAPVYTIAADGREIHTGVPPRNAAEFSRLVAWLDELNLREEFPDVVLLELGIEKGGIQMWEVGRDALDTEIFGAAREALQLIASKLTAREFFIGAQSRGMASAIVYAPEEVLDDPHFIDRQFPVAVDDDRIGRPVRYPGPPFRMCGHDETKWRSAPRLGEHNVEILPSELLRTEPS